MAYSHTPGRPSSGNSEAISLPRPIHGVAARLRSMYRLCVRFGACSSEEPVRPRPHLPVHSRALPRLHGCAEHVRTRHSGRMALAAEALPVRQNSKDPACIRQYCPAGLPCSPQGARGAVPDPVRLLGRRPGLLPRALSCSHLPRACGRTPPHPAVYSHPCEMPLPAAPHAAQRQRPILSLCAAPSQISTHLLLPDYPGAYCCGRDLPEAIHDLPPFPVEIAGLAVV